MSAQTGAAEPRVGTGQGRFRGSRFAPSVAVVLLALIAARVAEIVPGAARFRPALLAALLGGSLVLFNTSPSQLYLRLRNPVTWEGSDLADCCVRSKVGRLKDDVQARL